jgi:hypothetical protein
VIGVWDRPVSDSTCIISVLKILIEIERWKVQ